MATKKTTTENNIAKFADVSVLKNPRITEKAANNAQYNIYLFDVTYNATKSEIAKAFQTVYKQKAIKVNTVTVLAKTKFSRGKLGTTTRGKKAYVFIPKGTTIEII